MITSTIVVPNAIQVALPQSSQQSEMKPVTRVTIDSDLKYYVASGNDTEQQVEFEAITPFLQVAQNTDPSSFVALYADESVPYGEVVKVLNIANKNKLNMVLMTRPEE